ncbi:MAG: divergent polysaccharide deacetylase family protein [Rhodospirillales bacterium]|nr:divergent polysaccharide deacetylase family protein [Rhodospirillales bacterium]
MALLIVMALGGVFGGYYIGKEVAPAPKPKPEAQKTAPEPLNGTYEESLPRDIIIESDGVLKRIALPQPDSEIDLGNGKPGRPHPAPVEESAQPDSPEPAPQDTANTEPEKPAPSPKQTETASLPPVHLDTALPSDIAELQREKGDQLPPWQRYALPVTFNGKPKIVIVIDDVGLDRRRARQTIKLPGPLTMSFMAYAEDLNKQASAAREAGHELMLHVPMEPSSSSINPGPNVLLSGMPTDELKKNVEWNLAQLDGYVGINNHMGSRFTADPDGMKVVVASLKQHGYLFLDSVTSGKSVAHETARDGGIPFAVRNVFLDHDDDLDAIRRQLRHTEQIARKTGLAIAIGHPRDKTIEALKDWLPKLEEKGFQLVPISSVVRVANQ